MKILFAADGSKYTKKALAFLVTHEALAGEDGELVVLNVQPQMPPRVRAMVGASTIASFYRDESSKVLGPIERFLKRHAIRFSSKWAAGVPGEEIVRAAKRDKAHLIVMGTHGHSALGNAILGSVGSGVLARCSGPVLFIR